MGQSTRIFKLSQAGLCRRFRLKPKSKKTRFQDLYKSFFKIVHLEGMSNSKEEDSGLKRYQKLNIDKVYLKWRDVFLKSAITNNKNQSFIASAKEFKSKPILLYIDHYVPHIDKDAGSKSTYSILITLKNLGFQIVFLPENFYPHQPY